MKTLLANIKEQSGPDIISFVSKTVEVIKRVAIGFKVLDKSANQFNKIGDITVLFRIDNLFKHFFLNSKCITKVFIFIISFNWGISDLNSSNNL